MVSPLGHNLRGLRAPPPQPFPQPLRPSPAPLGLRHSGSFSKSGQAFLSFLWGQTRALARPKGPFMRPRCPGPRTWMDGPTSSSFSAPPPSFLAPLSYFPFSPYKWTCPRPLPSCLISPRPCLPTPPRAGRRYWCFFISGPSSMFVFCVSPLPDTSFSPSLNPGA